MTVSIVEIAGLHSTFDKTASCCCKPYYSTALNYTGKCDQIELDRHLHGCGFWSAFRKVQSWLSLCEFCGS